ncbi:AAA family ATPase [Ruegeria sp.]|uniref:AAA family ATPase n=1 Tax=Ruegeria sp. TaxID=1879320 RepID=UPI002313F38D|nr:AAA family ATPase [Ruegeria sp.]MDA7965162.1 AAA family ATPase [Ruegeria sp.]
MANVNVSFVPGFQLSERLYESADSFVFRATRDADGERVVIKILKSEFPTASRLARYRREFEITSSLALPGVIRALELRRHDKSLLMVLEDFDGISIADLLSTRSLSHDEFLDTALQIARTVDGIHQSHVIHKDISPQNILIHPGTGEVKVIDFGIATQFSTEHPVLMSPEVLEGTLPYISPEQTGRMNRALDHRTDFYSMGATFYQMLTGMPPFEVDDKLELVHCHVAREPVPAHRRNPDISLALSKIISRMMAKKAEDRYQSTAGIIADLEAVRAGGNLDRFEPGRRDRTERFTVPERLYGRDREVRTLMEAFERVRQGPAEMMLVSGYSGAGKTALVNEVHKPITRARGYFIKGKFDQFKKNDPYSGLMHALQDLVRQLLTESPARHATWRKELNEALAPNASVILDVLPELELIIGPQPSAPELDATEATNRFNQTIRRLLRALCARDRVVVLFLDDLQWADSATLGLLKVILTDDQIGRLLLIGAYRSNEVDAMHPMMRALDAVREAEGRVSSLSLAPLGLSDIANLLADTLHAEVAQLIELAQLVVQKTQGNPFFARQFLMDLHHEKLIRQQIERPDEPATWTWDIKAIRAAQITDNVVDLLLEKMRRLKQDTQTVLRIAACIGSRFDIDTLALILKIEPQEAFDCLLPAIQEEMIQPLSDLVVSETENALSPLLVRDFAFQHDRVQQAAYGLIEADDHNDVHLAIGRQLRAQLTTEELNDRIFEVVDQLNLGRDGIEERAEQLDLARLDLIAARKASDSAAYGAALSFANVASELLGPDGWDEDYDLMFEAQRQSAALEYLTGNFERCTEIVTTTLDHARTDLEKAEIYFTRIAQHTLLMEFEEAIDAGIKALGLVGVQMRLDNLEEDGQNAIGQAAAMLGATNPAALFDNPDVTSPEIALAQRSLRHLTIAAFLYNQQLFPLIVGTSVQLSLKHGNAPESALFFANFGLILGAFMGKYREGLAFGELALRLCDKFGARAPTATVCLVTGVELVPWVQHVRNAIPVIERGYHEGLNSGDILWAGYLVMYRVVIDSFAGKPLNEVLDAMPAQLDTVQRAQNHGAAAGIHAYRLVLSTLAGRSHSSADFSTEDLDEATFLARCEENQMSMAICFYRVLKAQALYVFGRPQEALAETRLVEPILHFVVNHPCLADHLLYQSLSIAALYSGDGSDADADMMRQLEANDQRLSQWAESGPDNFEAKRLIVAAEIARLKGSETEVLDLLDGAIAAAQKGRFLQDEALACELAARYVMNRRPDARIGMMYLRDARYAYRLWGAQRKVEELELEFPQLLTDHRDSRVLTQTLSESIAGTTEMTANQSLRRDLDLDTLLKAAQTISAEVVLDRLLDRLLGLLIENAGAQRGVLLLARGDELMIDAEVSVISEGVPPPMPVPLESEDGAKILPTSVINYTARTRDSVLVDDAQIDERFMVDPYVQENETRSVLCQPILHQNELIGLVYLENNLISAAFKPERAHLLSLLSGQIAVSMRNAEIVEHLEEKVRERTEQLEVHANFLEQTFGQFLASEVVDQLLKSPDGVDFSGKKTTVTVMMSDLRGFATLSDTLPPESIVTMLNNYLSEMTNVIQKYNGTIDAFIGDAILVVFGAPLQRPDDAERALACALEMQRRMDRVNEWNTRNDFPEIEMGIGVNTGEVVVGNIGSDKRAKYSVVGRTTNFAARIESYTVGGQILIADATRRAVKAPLDLGSTRIVEPKGAGKPLELHELIGLGGAYAISLSAQPVEMAEIDPPLALLYRSVIGKQVVGDAIEGELVQLSSNGARIKSAVVPKLFTDLQLQITWPEASGGTLSLYAKVLGQNEEMGCFAVRFTAVPPNVRAAIDEVTKKH